MNANPFGSSKERPRIAHITNHGYAGVTVPYGGAPDTGGQNVYVNFIVETMVELGYHVTVFTRGGFPFFEQDEIRQGIEPYGEHARYVYIPGGGDSFIRKEDIAVALDEEVDWLEDFIAEEAEQVGCAPWELYEFVDTHYWDAGVIGMQLQMRWRNRIGILLVEEALRGVVADKLLDREVAQGSLSAAGGAFEQIIGRMLWASTDELQPPESRVREALLLWAQQREIGQAADTIVDRSVDLISEKSRQVSPALIPVAAADIIGEAVVELWDPDRERIDGLLSRADRHVFTPHSLGVLKEENYRSSPEEVRRALKFCERRDHETAVCHSARAFAATSTEIAERLRTHHQIPTSKMFYFPAGVDRRVFRRYTADELRPAYEYIQEKTGKSFADLEKAVIIFETSRMDQTKRKDLVLEAFARVAPQHPDALCLIGGGPENDIYRGLTEMRESNEILRKQSFLLDFIPDELMYKIFGRADIFVTPSEMEGFGLSAAQAAAVGSALITSTLVPFALQYVPEDALVVRAGDVDGFAQAMDRLLADPEERLARGRRLSEKTRSLDWTEQTRAFFEYLRRGGLDVRSHE